LYFEDFYWFLTPQSSIECCPHELYEEQVCFCQSFVMASVLVNCLAKKDGMPKINAIAAAYYGWNVYR